MESNWDLPDNVCKVVGHEIENFQCGRCRFFDIVAFADHVRQEDMRKAMSQAQQQMQSSQQQAIGGQYYGVAHPGAGLGGLFGSPFK